MVSIRITAGEDVKRLFPLLAAVVFVSVLMPASVAGQGVDQYIPPDVVRDFNLLRGKLQRSPNDVALLNSLGIIYARVGQLDEAIEVWKRGLTIDPGYVHLYNNMASALKSRGRFNEARNIYQEALKRSPSYWVYFNMGLLEREANNPALAQRYFQACLQLFPNFEPALTQLTQLARAAQPQGFPALPGTTVFRNPGQLPLPGEYGAKQPVDFSGVGGMPAPWELPAESGAGAGAGAGVGKDYEPSSWRAGRSHQNVVPETPLTLEACVEIIAKIPAGEKEKIVALTFDDGPHAELTPRLLTFLSQEQVPATFFLIGSRAEAYPDIVQSMSQAGHEVANHSWDHRSLVKQGSAQALAGLQRTGNLLSGLSGKSCRLVRPPFGHTNSRVVQVIESQGWKQIMWDVDSRDWAGGTNTQILSRVLKRIGPGSIVLYHDIHSGALRTLPILVTALKRCGYRFVTVSELLKRESPAS
jgi:peptidoglycan/xylan/chitin deacetylase (PgdA/CDA1 family)